jgi:hypothetical protein
VSAVVTVVFFVVFTLGCVDPVRGTEGIFGNNGDAFSSLLFICGRVR